MNLKNSLKSINQYQRLKFFLSLVVVFLFPFLLQAQTDPLVISNVKAEVKGTDVNIVWRTSREASSLIEFGLTQDLGTSLLAEIPDLTDHKITLSNLLPEKTYYFRVISEDKFNQKSVSFIQTFKTEKEVDKKAPKISNLQILSVTGTTATIYWETDEKADSRVEFNRTRELRHAASSGHQTLKHEVTLRGLALGGYLYYFQVSSKDKAGNKAYSSVQNFRTLLSEKIDKEPLVITNITPVDSNDPGIAPQSVVITWWTNKLADGEIRYGKSPRYDKRGVKSEPPKSFLHKIILEDLEPETKYYFKITSYDIFNKEVSSEGHTFVTKTLPPLPKNVLVVKTQISYPQAQALYKTSDSPNIYAILNGKKHLIPSPSVFRQYGYEWHQVKTVSSFYLNQFKDVRLVKTPFRPTIYFLYTKQKMKKAIASPKVFLSYKNNRWEDVVIVSPEDLARWLDLKLVKTKDSPSVYLIENNIKRPIKSEATFERLGFDWSKIGIVNELDLDSYKTGERVE